MEEQILGVTKLVNALLGKPALALLAALHIHAENSEYPIPNHVAMELVVFLIAIVFFTWLKGRLSVENPGGTQQCMEALLTNSMGVGARDLLEDTAGHGAEKYLPMIGSIGIFVLMSNLISLVPGFSSPTAENSVPLGCAIVVFLYYNWSGSRITAPCTTPKRFWARFWSCRPSCSWWRSSATSRACFRSRFVSGSTCWSANFCTSRFSALPFHLFLFVGKLNALGYILAPFPLLAPCVFILLHIFVGFIQAFVFTLLPIIYLGGAVAEEH